MAKIIDDISKANLIKECEEFIENANSNMYFNSKISSDLMNLKWLDEIEFACSYIDNIIRAPRLTLVNDENVLKIEKVKKVTVESVKNLSLHTQYIDKIDPKSGDVEPSKMLDVRSEDSFNTYENRFVYTLIKNVDRFLLKKKDFLDNMEISNSKTLEFSSNTRNNREKINIEMKLITEELPKDNGESNLEDEINKVKQRIQYINQYMASWYKSEMYKSLEKAHVPLVMSPIRKTNLILKNPNFQIASRLWVFLQTYEDEENIKDGTDTTGDETLISILNDSFLMDYYVLDSIRRLKREQKQKLADYSIMMIKHQIKNIVKILLNSGIEINDSEIIEMLKGQINEEKGRRLIGSDDVKKKFKSAMDEYLERTKEFL